LAYRYGRSATAFEKLVPEIQELLSRETNIEMADQAEQKPAVAKRRAPAIMPGEKRKKPDCAMDTNQKWDSCCSRHIAAAGDKRADGLLEQVR
jgi:hypothetical protein